MRSESIVIGSLVQALAVTLTSFRICILLSSVVCLYTVQEFLSAFRVSDVLHSDVNSLFNIAVADNFVDDNTDSTRSNVVDDAGATMVEFVGHAFLLSSISFNVNNVANTVVDEVG